MIDREIAQLRLQLEIADHGMGMPRDPERVRDLRKMLDEARQRKVSERLARMRARRELRS
jgi:formate-dependent nitrite reductase cytochrome c552 subunit